MKILQTGKLQIQFAEELLRTHWCPLCVFELRPHQIFSTILKIWCRTSMESCYTKSSIPASVIFVGKIVSNWWSWQVFFTICFWSKWHCEVHILLICCWFHKFLHPRRQYSKIRWLQMHHRRANLPWCPQLNSQMLMMQLVWVQTSTALY